MEREHFPHLLYPLRLHSPSQATAPTQGHGKVCRGQELSLEWAHHRLSCYPQLQIFPVHSHTTTLQSRDPTRTQLFAHIGQFRQCKLEDMTTISPIL